MMSTMHNCKIDCMLLFAPSVASSVRPGVCSPIFYRGSFIIARISRVDLGCSTPAPPFEIHTLVVKLKELA